MTEPDFVRPEQASTSDSRLMNLCPAFASQQQNRRTSLKQATCSQGIEYFVLHGPFTHNAAVNPARIFARDRVERLVGYLLLLTCIRHRSSYFIMTKRVTCCGDTYGFSTGGSFPSPRNRHTDFAGEYNLGSDGQTAFTHVLPAASHCAREAKPVTCSMLVDRPWSVSKVRISIHSAFTFLS